MAPLTVTQLHALIFITQFDWGAHFLCLRFYVCQTLIPADIILYRLIWLIIFNLVLYSVDLTLQFDPLDT